ncbi:type II toxin-antitoxin system VapC family toxin [Haloterrigena alkaliphila]|uniref:Ribonuclease VapC n=1 Tax=Haloterrigena alkaliphila TaxID=2816475 RepID=A0A8A2VNI8_9EURY|nr:type II toxin-antitoxin system VapC family toxin [Haloterrigena alkaliphila]QSW99688.1 type II toxin-antitoxin system VapC family toxin [Haloterrigena alkaliphila]
MVLLDSCFLIDLFTEDAAAVAKLDEFDWREVSVSTLTVSEVGFGLSDSDRERFETIVQRADVLPYGLAESRRAIAEQRRLRERGDQIGALDAMIAATAIEANKPVVTRNIDEFQRTNAEVTPY